jgi:hypothetical protein
MEAGLLYDEHEHIISAGSSQQASGTEATDQSLASWCVIGSGQTRKYPRLRDASVLPPELDIVRPPGMFGKGERPTSGQL